MGDVVVFDIGGVLLDWNPRYLYRKLFPGDPDGMEEFLSSVVTPEWNAQTDVGVPFADAIADLVRAHPSKAELIEAYWARWPEMLADPIDGMQELVRELLAEGVPLYAISNFSTETFHLAREAFPPLDAFAGIVVSGEERVAKPDASLFRILVDRFELDPARCVYVDDVPTNVETAGRLGFRAGVFTDADGFRRRLVGEGILTG
jgi:HAD superfamily hydrolase (TIGR01509 family)